MTAIKNLEWLESNKPQNDATAKIQVTLNSGKKITFIGKHAGGENYPYVFSSEKELSEKLKKYNNRKDEELQDSERIKEIKLNLENDQERFIEHVFVDWEIVGDDGEFIPYSKELCRKVLKKLTRKQWNKLAGDFENENFFVKSALTISEAKTVGNESGSG